VGRFNDRTESSRDVIDKNCEEEKSEHTDELLILQAAVRAILILLKKLSDYSMAAREDSVHQGEPKECRLTLLELQLQLLALPYSPPHSLCHSLPSDEHKDEEQSHCPQTISKRNPSYSSSSSSTQFAEVSDSAVKSALRAFTQFSSVTDPAVSAAHTSSSVTTSLSVPSFLPDSIPTSTCVPGTVSINAFTSLHQLETLQKYLKVVQIAQSTLAHLLLILTKRHQPPPLSIFNCPSDGPTPSEKTAPRGRKEKNSLQKSVGSRPVQALNKGQVQEREEVWFSLLVLCSNLQCIACTSSVIFFRNLISFSPPHSTTAAAVGVECGTYEEALIADGSPLRRISLSPSSIVSLLIVLASQRGRAIARSRRSTGGSDSSNSNSNSNVKSDSVDLHIVEELWAVVTHILGDSDRNPLSSLGALSADVMSYFLGRILCEWNWFKIPTEIFETRTLDLCKADSTSESGMSPQGDLVTVALRQLLLRWRKRPPLHCVCGYPDHAANGCTHSVKYFRKSRADTDLCPCCQVYSKGSAVGEVDRKLNGPDWLQAVQKMKFSSRFLIQIML
jgi:hypothetical protein